MKRKIIAIDENKCNGCGACITACSEGALAIIDGKARLVKDSSFDGFGDCLGEAAGGDAMRPEFLDREGCYMRTFELFENLHGEHQRLDRFQTEQAGCVRGV